MSRMTSKATGIETVKVGMVEAEERLWELIESATAGEEVIIVDEDGEAVRLDPINPNAAADTVQKPSA